MKTNLKCNIIAFYLCSTFVMFGKPGTVNHPPAPSYLEGLYVETDSNEYYFWAIGVICFAYLFLTLRDFARKINYQ